jgi:hypothetical protein
LSKLGKETIGSWEELTKQFTSNFKLTYKRPASIEEVKAYVQQRGETLRACISKDGSSSKIRQSKFQTKEQ